MRTYITLIIITIIITSCSNSNPFTTTNSKITGELINRDEKDILLVPESEDFNNIINLQKGIKIPVNNGKFEYTLIDEHIQSYMIIFPEELAKQGYIYRNFLNDSSHIHITIFPDDQIEKNRIDGGKFNKQLATWQSTFHIKNTEYEIQLSELRENKEYYSDDYSILLDEMKLETNEKRLKELELERRSYFNTEALLSDNAKIIFREKKKLFRQYKMMREKYIINHKDPLSYYLIYSNFFPKQKTKQEFYTYYEDMAIQFPNHPYTSIIGNVIHAESEFLVGNNYIDFSAKIESGTITKLSEHITKEITLINLWTTWCSSCRIKAIDLIPVYETYKNKGFDVIGICGVYNSNDDYNIALQQDNYPWINLIEFNNENQIWEQYGISGSGGVMFLIDNSGKILSIAPTKKEIEEILEREL